MKTQLAALVLLTATAGSAFAHGGDVIAGVAVGTVLGSAIASQPRAAVTVQYGSPYPPAVVYAPPPVAYAPPPPVVGYAPPPPVMVYPAPRVVYGTPYYGPPAYEHPGRGWGHYKHHHDRDEGWGRGRW